MPFRKLVEIATSACRTTMIGSFSVLPPPDIISDACYFWVDVFCKNQHVPAPAMDEFYAALTASGVAVITMWPFDRPLALSRVWCLFEIWASANKDLIYTFAYTEGTDGFDAACQRFCIRYEDYSKAEDPEKKEKFVIDVSTAEASQPADKDMILAMVSETMGIEELNDKILQALCNSLRTRYNNVNSSYACLTGDSLVHCLVEEEDSCEVVLVQRSVLITILDPDCEDPTWDPVLKAPKTRFRWIKRRIDALRPGDRTHLSSTSLAKHSKEYP